MTLRKDSLLPQRRPQTTDGKGQLFELSQAQFATKYPRVMATITLTVAGSITDGDIITVNLNLATLTGGKIAKAIAIVGADTVSTVAAKIAKAFNQDADFQQAGGNAYTALGVVTFQWPGMVGNVVTLTRTLSVSATVTGTISNSGAFSGGSGPIYPLEDFSVTYQNTFQQFRAGCPKNVTAGMVAAIIAAGKAII